MKLLTTSIAGLLCVMLQAQPSVQPLIQAEKDFEKMSHKDGLKKAFVFFADSAGLAFGQDGAVNAPNFWGNRQGDGFFSWAPSYAEVSDGGDWGYTTGAAQFRRKSLEDTVAFASQYTTVWHKDKAGNWKYLMDIGISHASIPPDTVCNKIYVKKVLGTLNDSAAVVMADKNFNNALVTNAKIVYAQSAGKHYLLNNEGYFISTSVDSAIIMATTKIVACMPTGVLIAPKGDMAFVYGRLRRGGKDANYVRIWRHEPAGWKVALRCISN